MPHELRHPFLPRHRQAVSLSHVADGPTRRKQRRPYPRHKQYFRPESKFQQVQSVCCREAQRQPPQRMPSLWKEPAQPITGNRKYPQYNHSACNQFILLIDNRLNHYPPPPHSPPESPAGPSPSSPTPHPSPQPPPPASAGRRDTTPPPSPPPSPESGPSSRG